MPNKNKSFAAVDLGSNSFHMVVANLVDGRALIVDRIKEMVRLAGGLDADRHLNAATMQTALQCLQRFGQRIKNIPAGNLRAVGTNTLRQARNSAAFLAAAERALGHNIEIISGREEARLVYLGVANTIFNATDRRLIVDIGGGSTELVIGRGFEAGLTESLFMGCVSLSRRYFAGGEITAGRMRQARILALGEMETVRQRYRDHGWDKAIGTSGTIHTILDIVTGQGWSEGVISAQALARLKQALIAAGHIDRLQFEPLSANRRPVFAGGVAVLSAVFEALGIEAMAYSPGALREGLLYEQIGRRHQRDVRDKTVARLLRRYSVDKRHADRVEKTAAAIFQDVRAAWGLEQDEDLKMIRWAARLHEIGLAVAHSQYHKHGAYLLSHSDMPGFSRQEQYVLSALVRLHRRKLTLEAVERDTGQDKRGLLRMIIVLRLAILLNRNRATAKTPAAGARGKTIELDFGGAWLTEHPLTEADLETETTYLAATDYKLRYR